MSKLSKNKPYRIIGAYDSETTNLVQGASKHAYPILHQLGLIDNPINMVTPDNVEQVTHIYLYRHTSDLWDALERIANANVPYVPVICCHNLSFDMYGLAQWLSGHNVRVLAKSARKPITFTILDKNDNARLVIWDTLIFSGKSLAYMGKECGYSKLVGDWDYDLIRTPETPLTDNELDYAKHDIYTLLAWLGYWCRLNPDIDPSDLALRVVSKTGIVRTRRAQRFAAEKGKTLKNSAAKYWYGINAQNAFADNDELFTCQAATRGGFTFCASANASRVFDYSDNDNLRICGFDATSQHPSQIVSHRYPVRFNKAKPDLLDKAFNIIRLTSLNDVLSHYEKPFAVAFYGCFEFTNLRPKKGTPFAGWGVLPLAYARCKPYEINQVLFSDAQENEEFRAFIAMQGYKDIAVNPRYSFSKLESADYTKLYITELTAWEICQCYDYDEVKALSGYLTLSFDKPSDMAVISVMQFYAGKNAFKQAREQYYNNELIINGGKLKDYGIPDFVIDGMENHTIDDGIVDSTYLNLKADLNALFGIEASNAYRRDTVLGQSGIEYTGSFGVENAPKNFKNWYQMGQRIVGWSRVAQIIVMLLCAPYVVTCINGDTDSIKFVIDKSEMFHVKQALRKMNRAIDMAKNDVCGRVRKQYPHLYDKLDGIGYYILEFTTDRFCASWNKAYCLMEYDKRDNKDHIKFTLAGVPTKKVNVLADRMLDKGYSYGEICDIFLGYNVTYAPDITGLNARSMPYWCSTFNGTVTDYKGNTAEVNEPCALCLYPMPKTINDTRIKDNQVNMTYALANRPSVNVTSIIITSDGVIKISDFF